MSERSREALLASCADLGEALVVQGFLDGAGIPARVGVDALAPAPCDTTGIHGPLAPRPVGIWVLEADVGRAHSVLATIRPGEPGGRLDDAPTGAAPTGRAAPDAGVRRAAWIAPAVAAMVLVVLALFAARG